MSESKSMTSDEKETDLNRLLNLSVRDWLRIMRKHHSREMEVSTEIENKVFKIILRFKTEEIHD